MSMIIDTGLAALLISSAAGLATLTTTQPYTPASDSVVVAELATGRDTRLRQLRNVLTDEPGNRSLATEYAWAAIKIAKQSNDPRFYGYAQAALAPWWQAADPAPDVSLLRATIKQHFHAFDAALHDLRLALRKDPRNAQAWITKATIHTAIGEYASSLASCKPLWSLREPILAAICRAQAQSFTHEAEAARRTLRTLASAEIRSDYRGWVLTLLAETSHRLADFDAAQHYFDAALELTNDHYLLVAYCDFLLARGRPRALLELLRSQSKRLSTSLFLREAIAQRDLGADIGQSLQELEARFARADDQHLADHALFALELQRDPHQALQLAQENWQHERGPREADLVLRAAHQARLPGAAEPIIQWAKIRRLQDYRIARAVEESR